MTAAASGRTPPTPTHGRHCPCMGCAKEDWTRTDLAPCGMHGPDCPNVYAPPPVPGQHNHAAETALSDLIDKGALIADDDAVGLEDWQHDAGCWVDEHGAAVLAALSSLQTRLAETERQRDEARRETNEWCAREGEQQHRADAAEASAARAEEALREILADDTGIYANVRQIARAALSAGAEGTAG